MNLLPPFFAALIIFSVIYELNTRSRELHYLHHLPAGTLSLLSHAQIITQQGLNVTGEGSSLSIMFNGKQIVKSTSQSFILMMQSSGRVEGHGDSFYQVSDKPETICSNQSVQGIRGVGAGEIEIVGQFWDCPSSQYVINLQVREKQQLVIKVQNPARAYNRVYVKFFKADTTQYFGLGEQFSNLNLGVDRPYSMMVREKGIGRGDAPETGFINFLHGIAGTYYTSYCPAPIWLSSDRVGYILHSLAYSAWLNNMVLVWGSEAKFSIIIGSSMKEVVSRISQHNGYTGPVHEWVNGGAILGLQGGTDEVIQKFRQIKQKKGVVSGIWIQDWVNKRHSKGYSRLWWNWELDEKHYFNWTGFRQFLRIENVRLLIYVNSMFSDPQEKPHHRTNYYQQALEKGYFIKDKNGQVFHTLSFSDYHSALIDFDNPAAADFYKDILRNAIEETGADGMMVDFAENYPIDQESFGSLEEAIRVHNNYPNQYLRAVQQVVNELPGRQFYTFSRAGHLGTANLTQSLWAGDQNMNFKKNSGLPSCLTAMLSSSLVGYSNTHCDVGGYVYFKTLPFIENSLRTEILMIRWLQLAAFSPVFRTHQGNKPDQVIHVYDSGLNEQFAFYSQIFAALSQYRSLEARSSAQLRIPLIRPVFLEHEEPLEVFKVVDQFYLGSDILVCPILQASNHRSYYLPKGEWVHLWSGQARQGCDCYLQSEEFLPPVFIKSSSNQRSEIINKIGDIQREFHSVSSRGADEMMDL